MKAEPGRPAAAEENRSSGSEKRGLQHKHQLRVVRGQKCFHHDPPRPETFLQANNEEEEKSSTDVGLHGDGGEGSPLSQMCPLETRNKEDGCCLLVYMGGGGGATNN